MADPVRFVFSFRSPYAWIAARWILPGLPSDLDVVWEPFFPLPTFTNFPKPIEAKVRYLVRDVIRLVDHYGGDEIRWPTVDDPDWTIPHCAFLEAQSRGRARDFALGVWDARFGRGENVGEEAVLARVAEDAGLDPAVIVAAGLDEENRAGLTARIQRDYDEEGVFGVPTLILPRGTRFWGHDRIDWAIREGKIAA